ncbi:MAG: hypothetical protein LBI56_03450 [Puniceicoccales bacterium]|jgi:hypothetical protein|nr:hypothetical protein [Puniceicoccales bacterium]
MRLVDKIAFEARQLWGEVVSFFRRIVPHRPSHTNITHALNSNVNSKLSVSDRSAVAHTSATPELNSNANSELSEFDSNKFSDFDHKDPEEAKDLNKLSDFNHEISREKAGLKGIKNRLNKAVNKKLEDGDYKGYQALADKVENFSKYLDRLMGLAWQGERSIWDATECYEFLRYKQGELSIMKLLEPNDRKILDDIIFSDKFCRNDLLTIEDLSDLIKGGTLPEIAFMGADRRVKNLRNKGVLDNAGRFDS